MARMAVTTSQTGSSLLPVEDGPNGAAAEMVGSDTDGACGDAGVDVSTGPPVIDGPAAAGWVVTVAPDDGGAFDVVPGVDGLVVVVDDTPTALARSMRP